MRPHRGPSESARCRPTRIRDARCGHWAHLLCALCGLGVLSVVGCDQTVVVGRMGTDGGRARDASQDADQDADQDAGDDSGAADGGTGCATPLVADSLGVGTWHACALRAGAVRCWGGGVSGQLCNGDTQDMPRPVAPVGLDTYTALYVGGQNTCMTRSDGALRCCGDNFSGTLADGTSQGNSRPVTVSASVSDLVIGFSNVYATRAGGGHDVWGDNEYGQLGLGPATVGTAVRSVTALPTESFTQISANTQHACGVTAAGALRCAGTNAGGELGIPLSPDRDVFTAVPAPTTFRSVSAGRRLSCALSTADELFCWGTNEPTMVTGTVGFVEMPTRVGAASDYESVSVGFDHVCALRGGGRLFCWGSGEYGKLGFTAVSADAPTEVTPGVSYREVRAGPDFTCAIRAVDSVVVCFGDDSVGQTAGRSGPGPQAVCLDG